MKKLLFSVIVACCAGTFYSCEQSSIGPVGPPMGQTYTVASYMLTASLGDSETFKQSSYDSTWSPTGRPDETVTMTVVGKDILLSNGEKATKVLYTYGDHSMKTDSEYIAATDSGIVSYSDVDCQKSQNIILAPLTAGTSFHISRDDYRLEDYIAIDSLNTTIKTSAGSFSVLKLTECHVAPDEASDQIRDSTVIDFYLAAGYLEVYQVQTDMQKVLVGGGTEVIISKLITVTDLTSKSW
jgi:hypothetical protein